MADVVFIGAGPVGIWTALQIKQRCPGADIVMYERHEVYQRTHVLRLDHWSMLLYAKGEADEAAHLFYEEVAGTRLTTIQREFAKSFFIRTSDLETALLNYARRKGIDIRFQRIESPAEAEALHPEVRFFVAGDGANSPMRTALLGPDSLEKHDLQYVVELKYEEAGDSGRFNTAQAWQYNRSLHHTAMDYVGKTKDGRTPVTLRLLLKREVYDRLPEMTFANPHMLAKGGLPAEVEADIRTYLTTREAEFGTTMVPGTGKLSRLILSMYASSRFAVKRDDVGWFLVGDAALGVPYFRALNSGMMLSSRLAQFLAHKGRLWPEQVDKKIREYNFHRPFHVVTEFMIARSKDAIIDSFGAVRELFAEQPGTREFERPAAEAQEKEEAPTE
jgi:2-polyprenyl-6-methoxyphenol hydroxylase-like FAD-dependent oxidoreductase